jgi:hypothetical protein
MSDIEQEKGLLAATSVAPTLTDDEIYELLLRAAQRNPSIMKEIMRQDKEKAAKPKHLSIYVKEHRTCNKKVICKHCHNSYIIPVVLLPSEKTVIVNKDGSMTTIKYEQVDADTEVKTYTSHCNECEEYIKKLSREDLEKKYIELLLMLTVPLSKGGNA